MGIHGYSSVPPWKNLNLVFSRDNIKTSVQNFCSILKYSPASTKFSLVCVTSSSLLMSCAIRFPHGAWVWSLYVHGLLGYGERMPECMVWVHVTSKREQERERELSPYGAHTICYSLVAARPTWSCAPQWERYTNKESVSPGGGERVSMLLCFPGIILTWV